MVIYSTIRPEYQNAFAGIAIKVALPAASTVKRLLVFGRMRAVPAAMRCKKSEFMRRRIGQHPPIAVKLRCCLTS